MAAFTSISEMLNEATGGNNTQEFYCYLDMIEDGGGRNQEYGWQDNWLIDNTAAAGSRSVPGTATACDKDTPGAIPYVNAAASHTKYLMRFELHTDAVETTRMFLYDRLVHRSGFVSNLSSDQTVGGTPTRNTGGEGNEIWIVNLTDPGGTATTITAMYTNQAGTGSRVTLPTTWKHTYGNIGDASVLSLPLQDGDTGVRTIQSVKLAASTGTAGNFAVVLARPITVTGADDGRSGGASSNVLMNGVQKPIALEDDMCLSTVACINGTSEVPNSFSLLTLDKDD